MPIYHRHDTGKKERAKNRAAVDQQYREWAAANTEPKKPRRVSSRSRCGEVTTTCADGAVTVEPALTASALRRIAPERLTISPALRSRVLRRDKQTCRYCGNITGPFEIDHVLPVAHGGVTQMRNLVTACFECNRRKGAQAWEPKPLPG